jgi:hypothetical protein
MQLKISEIVLKPTKETEIMKANSAYGLISIALITILAYSCEFYCTEGNGVVKTENRLVAEFTGIENSTSFDVEITVDTVNDDECIDENNAVRIDIRMPLLDYVELNGSGSIEGFGFNSPSFEIRNSGSGDVDLTNISVVQNVEIYLSGSGEIAIWGKAREGEYHLSGSGDISSRDMRVDNCYALNSGSGDIECFAYLLLDAELSGSGDILFYGSPDEVLTEDNGSGEIRQMK